MQVKIRTRFGKEVTFEKKDRGPFVWRVGQERYMEALVRHYYPAVYRRHQKMKAVSHV